ncbi:MAG: BadF/BadG/BcrA/BcrD ATPase family protein, partial [Calditrichia bacterium]
MYYLGVDGGGTKTNAVLTNAHGDDIRTIREGSGNVSLLDRGSVAQLIRNLIKGLLKGEPVEKIHKAVFAFAGVGRPEEKSIVKEIIKGSGIKNFSLMTDAELLYYSIFGEKRGMLLSSGTGSICLVRNGKNRLKQVGGRGYLLGDEGSGFDIGNKAIRAAVHDQEMGKPISVLTRELLSFFGLNEPGELITIMYSSKNPARLTASCAKLVCEEAEKHEPNALKIVDAAARALFELAMEAVPYLEEEALIEIAL